MDLKKEYENITEQSSLTQIQKYIHNMIIQRGFEEEDIKDRKSVV